MKAESMAKRKAEEAQKKARREAEIERKKDITLVVTAAGYHIVLIVKESTQKVIPQRDWEFLFNIWGFTSK